MDTAKFIEQRRRQLATWKAVVAVAIKAQDAKDGGAWVPPMREALRVAAEREVSGKSFGFRF